MYEFRSVSVLLPAINETFSFLSTVRIISEECDPADLCEIIAIVCKKTEKESLKAIENARELAEAKGIPYFVLWQKRPFVGGAFQDGFEATRGSHILMMSSDEETDPHLVAQMITLSRQYPDDMITASRWLKKGSFQGYSPPKLFLNRLFQKFFAFLYGTRLTDITYAFRLAPADLLNSIRWEELRHPFFLETAIKPIRLGVTVREIPAQWTARKEGESQNSFWQTFKYLRIAFRARFERREEILKGEVQNDGSRNV